MRQTAESSSMRDKLLWRLPPPKSFAPILKRLPLLTMRGRVPIETIVTQDFQREFLLRSGVEENAFRGTLDPSFVSSMLNAITTQNLDLPEGDPAFKPTSGTYGTVHVSELMKLHRPLQAGEVLTITTRGQREEPHPKGSMVTTNYRVTDAANEIVLEMERKTLTLTAPEDTAAPGVAELQAPKHLDAREGTTFVSSRTMTPDMVAGYCWFVTNRIHNEVETANAFGYRAPIWAGTQGMHMTMAHLYSLGVPQTLTALFTFKRPVFWTDTLEVRPRAPAHVLSACAIAPAHRHLSPTYSPTYSRHNPSPNRGCSRCSFGLHLT